jgi:hypothetical protein
MQLQRCSAGRLIESELFYAPDGCPVFPASAAAECCCALPPPVCNHHTAAPQHGYDFESPFHPADLSKPAVLQHSNRPCIATSGCIEASLYSSSSALFALPVDDEMSGRRSPQVNE